MCRDRDKWKGWQCQGNLDPQIARPKRCPVPSGVKAGILGTAHVHVMPDPET